MLTSGPPSVNRPARDLQFPERPADSSGRMLERTTVSIPRACDVVGVSRRTIYNWMASGKVQYVRTAGGSVRIFTDTLWRDGAAPDRAGSGSTPPQQPGDNANQRRSA
jgi:excisionase family DNA binding protein